MRPSPIAIEYAARVRNVKRDRRAILVVASIAALAAASSVLVGARAVRDVNPPFYGAIARVTGSAGAGTGVAVTDSTVITDARAFPRVGDTLSVTFFEGNESQGVVVSSYWTADSLGVSTVRLLAGGITPKSVPIGGQPDDKVWIVCVNAENRVWSLQTTASGDLDQRSTLVGWLTGCDGNGAAVFDREGVLSALFVTGPGLRAAPKWLDASALPRP